MLTATLIAISFSIGFFIESIIGFGGGLIAYSFLGFFIDFKMMILAGLYIGTLSSAYIISTDYKSFDKKTFKSAILLSLVGTIIGVIFFTKFSSAILTKLFAFLLIILSIKILFFDKYIINIELYKGIIAYMSNIGMTISLHALDPNINMNGHFNDLGPSKVISYFACVSDLIHIGADKSGVVDYITLKIVLAALEIILFVILSIIAYCMLEVYVQMYFLLYAGFVLTGFAGSSWTNAFWQKYVHSVSYIAIKFFVISILMGLMLSTVEMWADQISQAAAQENNGAGITAAIMNIVCSAIILVFMIKELPNWAAKSLSATVKLRG